MPQGERQNRLGLRPPDLISSTRESNLSDGGLNRVKIAQVAPLYESVPPKYYGGAERVVSYLTEELVRQGHDVTLFASGDSVAAVLLLLRHVIAPSGLTSPASIRWPIT